MRADLKTTELKLADAEEEKQVHLALDMRQETKRTRANFIAIQEEQIRSEDLSTVRKEKQKLSEVENQLKLLESMVAKKTKQVQTPNQQDEVRARIVAIQERLNGTNLDVGFENVEKEEVGLKKTE